jgi:hypothetical protein
MEMELYRPITYCITYNPKKYLPCTGTLAGTRGLLPESVVSKKQDRTKSSRIPVQYIMYRCNHQYRMDTIWTSVVVLENSIFPPKLYGFLRRSGTRRARPAHSFSMQLRWVPYVYIM